MDSTALREDLFFELTPLVESWGKILKKKKLRGNG
jgi:hypothetical protein